MDDVAQVNDEGWCRRHGSDVLKHVARALVGQLVRVIRGAGSVVAFVHMGIRNDGEGEQQRAVVLERWPCDHFSCLSFEFHIVERYVF